MRAGTFRKLSFNYRWNMKVKTFLILMFLISLVTNCQVEEPPRHDIIAVVNGREITQDEFRLFYELDPNFGIDSAGLPALKAELNFYIHQILALEKAETNGLTSDPFFTRARSWELRQAALRELFRQDIQNHIIVTEEELRTEYINNNMMVHIRHIFCKSKSEIIEYQKRLMNGESFLNLAKEAFADSALASGGGDLGWMKFGDLDDDFSTGIKRLKKDELSDIIQTKWGWHIVQMLDFKKQLMLNDSDFQRQKSALTKKIQRQKSIEMSGGYIKEMMQKLNPQPDEKIFRLIWNSAVPESQQERSVLPRKISLTNFVLEKCRTQLAADLNEPFIKYKNGSISLKEFLDGIQSIPLGHRPVFKSARGLSDKIALWVRDEFLFKRALEKELDKNKTVLKEVLRFTEEQSYNYFLKEKMDKLRVPDSVRSYFNNKTAHHPDLASFHTLQQWEWEQAKDKLEKELKDLQPEITIDEQLLQEENKRINWDRRIRMFMVRKPE